MQYIIDFFGKDVPKKLSTMDIHLVYVSKRQKYAVIYCDTAKGEKELLKNLKNIKGFKGIRESLYFDETVNI
ncbi:conserved hypothetical protein (UPF0298) [Alteracholeplasma palmae J233]|uniref:Uncharacterized protein n=2 Tax=Acholeplasma palmae TaxID=38986 RepID=U4KNP7_ALTPJ|nr:conserved hypothetical protein (UPF0298) [Alteracholeplasma palmae J233]